MTLTTPGCPLHESIENGVKHRVREIEGINTIDLQLVWEPSWDPTKMSLKARKMLW